MPTNQTPMCTVTSLHLFLLPEISVTYYMQGTENSIIQTWILKQLLVNRQLLSVILEICINIRGSNFVLDVMGRENRVDFPNEVLLQSHLVIHILAEVTEDLLVH